VVSEVLSYHVHPLMHWKSLRTKLVEFKWPVPSPEEAMTPTNPLKRSLISSTAMLENLHINTCTIEYTSIKRVHTTLEFFLCKKCKGIPLKMLVTPSPFASQNGCCQANPTTSTKGKGEKEQKNGRRQGLYRRGRRWIRVRADLRERERE
jgi:hypothetical protein